jgi:hypothetical protein
MADRDELLRERHRLLKRLWACGARNRDGTRCQAPRVRGKAKCRMHGGLSSGPKSEAGWERTRAGHRRWLDNGGREVIAEANRRRAAR